MHENPGGLIAATVVLQIISIVCVALRFRSRRIRKCPLETDDWLILAALIVSVGLTVVEIWGCADNYLARSLMEIPPRQRGEVVRMAFLIELVYLVIGVVAIGLVKISVIYFYRRIFSTPKFKLLCNVYIVILILWTIAMFIALLSQCGAHLPALFTINGFFKYCHASHPIGYAFVTSDCITDLITVCLPVPMILGLHTSVKRKLLIFFVFLVGLFTTGASIGRAYFYYTGNLDNSYKDPIAQTTSVSIWNLVECHVGIAAACGPSLGPAITENTHFKRLCSMFSSFASSMRSASHSREKNPTTGSSESDDSVKVSREITVLSERPKAVGDDLRAPPRGNEDGVSADSYNAYLTDIEMQGGRRQYRGSG